MGKIIFITNIDRRYAMMKKALQELQEDCQMDAEAMSIKISEGEKWSQDWENLLSQADFFCIKWMGNGLDTPFFKKLLPFLQVTKASYYIDAAGTEENEIVSGIEKPILYKIKMYSLYNGLVNFKNLWLYTKHIFSHREDIAFEEPDKSFWSGIYHPRALEVYTDLTSYLQDFCNPKRSTIGILFYRDEWVWGDLAYQNKLIEEIESHGLNVICVFSNGMPIEEMGMPSLDEVFKRYFTLEEAVVVHALINCMKFSLTTSRSLSLEFLERLNVPVLQCYTLLTEYTAWSESLEGMNAMEVSISIALPEFDGIIHGIPIATKKKLDNGDTCFLPIDERIRRVVCKASKWANLRCKDNKDKKVAIIFHNYPPRNSNIGSAVGLDTIESIRLVLRDMQQQGYYVEKVPENGKSFIEELTANATNDRSMLSEEQISRAEKLCKKDYLAFFNELPESIREQLIKDWGQPPGEVMNYDDELLVPGTMNGNVFVTVQPPRGFGEDPSKIYHSPFCAPTHQYLGFYKWVRDVWQADAVIHVGTHGSLEWLPGKNAGLGNTCYPDIALGDLPNLYPYLITITGEGIQAKRRGAACLIEHLPPPQTRAGVYDELEETEKLLDEYVHFVNTQPENVETLKELLLKKVQEANLDGEIKYESNTSFDEYVQELHAYITDIKNMQVRTGLHIFGQPPANENMLEMLMLLTRLENGDVPALPKVLAEHYGFDYYELLDQSATYIDDLKITYGGIVDQIAETSREIIEFLVQIDFNVNLLDRLCKIKTLQGYSNEILNKLDKICLYICNEIYPNLLLTTQEMDNLLRGLSGSYIEPGPSGAPSSGGADLLPTGRNFYGVDPRNLPTAAAWEIGKNLGNQVIERYIAEEGRYPESIGIVLWSGSNMRSHGQCLAEFLYLLGVRPVWQRGSLRVVGLEVIPLSELKRPRIDVTARISGLFRDTMPSAIKVLDEAVLLVGVLEEDNEQNFVRKHLLEDSKELEKEGISSEEAWRQAAFRIFGDEQGVYGAGVAALLEARNWDSIDDIAEVYVRWGAHAYGGKTKGKFLPQLFRKRIGSLDVTIKNEENHETNMLSSDDYNAYHGGMIAAVRSIKGTAPRSYCGDSTDKAKVVMHSVQEETKRIFRSEAINPKFINGMMKHGYKGAADLANYVAHSYQWDATSDVMEDWMYEKYAEKYAFDPKVQEWMKDVNPWALQRMTEVLLEAEQRGLWKAKPETKEELQKLYLSIEGDLEERNDRE